MNYYVDNLCPVHLHRNNLGNTKIMFPSNWLRQGSPRPLQVWWFPPKDSQECSRPHDKDFLWGKDTKQNQPSAKPPGKGWSSENSRHKLPRVVAHWSHTEHADAFTQWAVTIRWETCQPGQLVRDSGPGVWLGPGHMGTLCVTGTKISDPQNKSRCST